MDKKKRKQIARRNFLESLRELGGGVAKSAKEDVIQSIGNSARGQIFGSGPSRGNNYSDFGPSEFPSPEIKERFRWSKQEFTDIRTQERLLFKQTEQEARVKIEGLRAELLKLVKTTEGLGKEVQVAAIQAPVEPGIYHLNFLERLREFIISLRKNIAESRHWLAMCNAKAKKRNFYWQQVRKSGTKFMLSQERYMATQAG